MFLVGPFDFDGMGRAVNILDSSWLSIDMPISTFSTASEVYLAVLNGNRKSVRPSCLRQSWEYRSDTVRLAPAGTGKTLVLNKPVPIHSNRAGSRFLRTISSYIRLASAASSNLPDTLSVDHQRHLLHRPVVRQRENKGHFHGRLPLLTNVCETWTWAAVAAECACYAGALLAGADQGPTTYLLHLVAI